MLLDVLCLILRDNTYNKTGSLASYLPTGGWLVSDQHVTLFSFPSLESSSHRDVACQGPTCCVKFIGALISHL